jgi:hypothetical protein
MRTPLRVETCGRIEHRPVRRRQGHSIISNVGNPRARLDEMGNGALAIGPKLPRPSSALTMPRFAAAPPERLLSEVLQTGSARFPHSGLATAFRVSAVVRLQMVDDPLE